MRIRLNGKGLGVRTTTATISSGGRRMKALVLSPEQPRQDAPGVLWIHGGGFATGMKEMVFMSRAVDLVTRFGAIVVSPGYRLSWMAPFPAAFNDCYAALLWLRDHAAELGVNPSQIMVGGESAGGGLAASLCLAARDRGDVRIAYQMPLYPMIDNLDTPSSRDNRAKVWNTRCNHQAWKLYLRKDAKSGSVSASGSHGRGSTASQTSRCSELLGASPRNTCWLGGGIGESRPRSPGIRRGSNRT